MNKITTTKAMPNKKTRKNSIKPQAPLSAQIDPPPGRGVFFLPFFLLFALVSFLLLCAGGLFLARASSMRLAPDLEFMENIGPRYWSPMTNSQGFR